MLSKDFIKEVKKSLKKDIKNWEETLQKFQESQVEKLVNDTHQKLYNHYFD